MSGERPDTRLVEGGRRPEWTQGVVNPPVWRASTILFDSCAALADACRHNADGGLFYGRRGTPTQWALADALTGLEPGAEGTMLFPSGVAAIAVALLSVLKPGDELLMVDSVYEPTRAFCRQVLAPMGISTRFYDPLLGGDIAALLGPQTRAVFLESPGSLTFEVQDIPAIVAAARAAGAVTLLDNTWATPLFLPALALGVDLSILACTKYVVGHSDAMLGAVTAAPGHYAALRQTAQRFGQHVGPDDAALGLRGLRTMGVRLRQHQASGLAVARWLAARPEVARVLHPALPDCPGHALWQRDFTGASGLFSVVLAGGDAAARAALIDGLRHFGIGFSWGGYESLALPVDPAALRSATRWQAEGPVMRLHIGLESVEDLIKDLEAGLARFRAARG
ncbi:cystathionine beta-lyase [Sphingomonas morindae]|uniref:Cystathionine beta-lyase n=1 Tax=Sphingomonas morindae TaxID=1541170 RepID=A0ABY4XCH8_9SPHN|nr:cystathionine beta-lyase [Sphingomonas morindae]USI74451.1 cystathionine beta-lyase [Sphingomonas morindae]